jgi:hypothetical protein
MASPPTAPDEREAGDYGRPATCVNRQWTCLAGEIDGRMCTCTEFHFSDVGGAHAVAASDSG